MLKFKGSKGFRVGPKDPRHSSPYVIWSACAWCRGVVVQVVPGNARQVRGGQVGLQEEVVQEDVPRGQVDLQDAVAKLRHGERQRLVAEPLAPRPLDVALGPGVHVYGEPVGPQVQHPLHWAVRPTDQVPLDDALHEQQRGGVGRGRRPGGEQQVAER